MLFEPGVNGSVLIFLNLAFVLLLLTLVGVTALVGLDLHILLLIVLAIGLMAGFNWYVEVLYRCVYLYMCATSLQLCISSFCDTVSHFRFIAQLPNTAPDSQTLSTAQSSETKKQE